MKTNKCYWVKRLKMNEHIFALPQNKKKIDKKLLVEFNMTAEAKQIITWHNQDTMMT